MIGLVQAVERHVDVACRKRRISKRGCSLSLLGVPVEHVAVDLDCDALGIPVDRTRCDYLFFGQEGDAAWVSSIELKHGDFRSGSTSAQLQGGADIADAWLPARLRFRFVPVLASGRGVHKERLRALRRVPITLRGQSRRPLLTRCSARLMDLLEQAITSE